MTKKGKDLIFVGEINRDGSGIRPMGDVSFLNETNFRLHRLSISKKTYIAINFNAYVVRLKQHTQ